MRSLRRRTVLLTLTFVLGACAVRELDGLSEPVAQATNQTVFFATQRDPTQLGTVFGQERRAELRFGKLTISIPPNHEPGQIEWTSRRPNAAEEFAITDFSLSPDIGSFAELVHERQDDLPGEVLVFVHGFNTTAAEAAFRLAQIQEDLNLRDPGVLFTWPSAALPTGYVYDRDSVLFARDDLVALLSALTDQDRQVIIAAHSLGAHLTMEALRQARLTGNDAMLDRINGVMLMSPDIDVDVFLRQADAIGELPQPFVVLSARKDQALGFYSILTGRPRLGATISETDLAREDVTIFNFSEFAEGQLFDHLVPVTSPTALAFLQSLINGRLDRNRSFGDFLTPSSSGRGDT